MYMNGHGMKSAQRGGEAPGAAARARTKSRLRTARGALCEMRLFLAAKAVATAAATAGGGGTFTNPVIGASCGSNGPKSWALTGCETPDPGVTRLGDSASSGSARWLALTTTQDANETFARHESSDLAVWTPAGHVWNSTTRPSWGTGNWFAPELHHVGRRWILVFSATWSANGKQAIGAAFAPFAGGPFIDSGAPIAVPHNNTNDPTLAHVGDTLWLVYKAKSPDRIFAQRVEPAGVPTRLQPSGEAVELISADRPWENKCVEAPWLVTNAPNSPWIYLFCKSLVPPQHLN
jgi:beta-xylosidase